VPIQTIWHIVAIYLLMPYKNVFNISMATISDKIVVNVVNMLKLRTMLYH
jgi:hypothetical protein